MMKPPPKAAATPPRRPPTPIEICTVHRPLPNCLLWSGTARSGRRLYEWFAHADGDILFVRAQRHGGFYELARTPPPMRRTILNAINTAQEAAR